MNQNQVSAVGTDIVMIACQFSIFGGYQRTSDDDIVTAGGIKPQGDILTKGGKHIFPLEKMAPFHQLKKELFRNLASLSIKMGNTYRYSIVHQPKVEQLIADTAVKYQVLLDDFVQQYDANLSTFIAQQSTPGLASIVSKSALTVDQAKQRFGFKAEMFTLQPVGSGSIESMAESTVKQVYVEVAQAALVIFNKSLMPEVSPGVRHQRAFAQKTKNALIKNVRDKLANWAHYDAKISNSIEMIDICLSTTQSHHFIEDTLTDSPCTRFIKLVELIIDNEKFQAASGIVMKDLDKIDMVLGLQSKQPPVMAVAVAEEPVAVIISATETVIKVDDADAGIVQVKADAPAEKLADVSLVIAQDVPKAKINPFANF